MATISKPYTLTGGYKAVASQVNSNLDTIYNDYNGNISNANCSATMALADIKLAQITTSGKVSATAFNETSQAAGVVLGHDGTNWTSISASTQRFKPLLSMGSSCAARFEKINLASAAAFTGELPAANISSDVRIKGWVTFEANGGGATRTIRDSYNVAQVLQYATGKYGVYWDTDFSNSTYAVIAQVMGAGDKWTGYASVNAGSVVITSTADNGTLIDVPEISVLAMGAQA